MSHPPGPEGQEYPEQGPPEERRVDIDPPGEAPEHDAAEATPTLDVDAAPPSDDESTGLPQPPPAAAPAAEPPRSTAEFQADVRARRSRFESLRDNFEAFAVAIVMALVIKHFCVEAFKIPTGSMYPTLYGATNTSNNVGDRILVDKYAYLFSGPDRWDIVVFRYPLQRTRNFIKRVGGLPGETLRIWEGDLWVRRSDDQPFRQARKPRRVRQQMFLPVYPPQSDQEVDLMQVFRTDGDRGAWTLAALDRFDFAGGERANLIARRRIGRNESHEDWVYGTGVSGRRARDVRLTFAVELAPPGTQPGGLVDAETDFTVSWQTDDNTRGTLVLAGPEGASHARIERAGEVIARQDLTATLAARKRVDVDFEFVDGDLRITLDGEEVAVLDAQRIIDSSNGIRTGTQQLRLSARGHPLGIHGLAIYRDIWYEDDFSQSEWNREGVTIPEDAYFMLGDNSGSSSDSRKWKLTQQKLEDGRVISYDSGVGSDSGYRSWREDDVRWTELIDHLGVTRRWSEDDELDRSHSVTRSAPFVWRDLILGRAFVVFWPLTPDFPGRLHWVH